MTPHGGQLPDSLHLLAVTSQGRSDYLEAYLQDSLLEPLNEYLCRPSKRIRHRLVELGFRLASGVEHLQPEQHALCATLGNIVEGIHAGSLIVDDIQDGSEERRGGPSLHLTEGLPRALNAGNWLYFWALKELRNVTVSRPTQALLHEQFQDALYDAHVGQALDLGSPVAKVPRQEIATLCFSSMFLKTGALTGLALVCGFLIAEPAENSQQTAAITKLGREFGMILQILDDLKNLKGVRAHQRDSKQLEDLRNYRPGYIWAFVAQLNCDVKFSAFLEAVERLPHEQSLLEWLAANDFWTRAFLQLEVLKKDFDQMVAASFPAAESYKMAVHGFHELSDQLRCAYEST